MKPLTLTNSNKFTQYQLLQSYDIHLNISILFITLDPAGQTLALIPVLARCNNSIISILYRHPTSSSEVYFNLPRLMIVLSLLLRSGWYEGREAKKSGMRMMGFW